MLRARQSGFTLVELLVGIAIIGILIALLVPAVQSVRETARRSACLNKQKNIALAAQAYYSSHQFFPRMAKNDYGGSPGYDPATGDVVTPVWSWTVFVLPHLEQQNVYEILAPTSQPSYVALGDPNALAAMQAKMSIFRCGSDSSPDLNSARPVNFKGLEYLMATSNYVGANASGLLDQTQYAPFTSSPAPPLQSNLGCTFGTTAPGVAVQGRGLFNCMRDTRDIEQIRDGQSNTIAIGERTWEYGPRGNTYAAGAANLFVARSFTGLGYLQNQGAGDICGTAGLGVSFIDPSLTLLSTDTQDSFSSSHPAGCNFAFVDGSTHFIANDVNLETLQRLMSVDDQLLLGEF